MSLVMVQLCHTRFSPPTGSAYAAPRTVRAVDLYYIYLAHLRLLGYCIAKRYKEVANMGFITVRNAAALVATLVMLAACGFGSPATERDEKFSNPNNPNNIETNPNNTIWSIFARRSNESVVSVNKYLWSASLEVLSFLPIQSVDPFTGVIVTGYGTPPGGGRAYRATVLIDDPALDARSLNVALQSQGGPVSRATSLAVEDAILSRARELRISDNKL